MFNAIEYINEPRWQKVSLGLGRITRLLELLGNPHERLKFVHVAGTNGKGSVCAYLESILRAAGYKTGLFTSPYIERFEERIRVNNKNIDTESLTAITLRVKEAAEIVEQETGEHPTEFELMTAVAFSYFEQCNCDIVVCEVGLGGRLDSTNAITPEVSVITKIGLDHTAMLGNTLAEIAGEKAGIIKPETPVVVANQSSEALDVVKSVAAKNGCNLVITDTESLQVDDDISVAGDVLARDFAYKGNTYMTQLLGDYQPQNAAVAIEVAAQLGVPDEKIFEGIYFTKWVGRFEVFTENLPCPVIIDGAHNPDGAAALKHSLQTFSNSLFASQPVNIIAVFGVLKDKDVPGILQNVGDLIDEFVIYEPANPRKMDADDLQKLAEVYAPTRIASDATSALEIAIEKVQDAGDYSQNLIVCFGSLYSIGDLRMHLMELAA
ncbi:MAG: folylpolyglutamate synthase/dihydrofolate synthase family protein [Phoenicibacter congonensis]|uniref:tetrahydrofolate synthase n=1 Tax=Phoenicibacter congonensis TaxID=1944646 RepID=A0AA43UA09_9ACTN|nr:folylpolyglutamate synthase/dihydrofolate synthase family protein [Phoenicibacter congonensis]